MARFGVMVTDEAAMSYFFCAIDSRIVSKRCFWNVTFLTPRVAAMALTRSTSKPITSSEPGLVNSNGA